MRSVLSLLASASVAVVPVAAEAGRTHYGWLLGTDVIPERGAEIQTWVGEENGKEPNDIHDTTLLWGAFVGVTDRLELGLPVEMLWRETRVADPTFSVQRFGIEGRYRFVSQDPEEAPPLAPLVRVALKRDVNARGKVRAETSLAASYQSGRVHALAEVGLVAEIGRDTTHTELRPGAGVSVRVTGDLRLGAEVFAQVSLDDERESWALAGPNLAWTHGRFWLSASFGIGVYQLETAPRVVWGILF